MGRTHLLSLDSASSAALSSVSRQATLEADDDCILVRWLLDSCSSLCRIGTVWRSYTHHRQGDGDRDRETDGEILSPNWYV